MTKTINISSTDNVIDLRDVIERFEQLEAELQDDHTGTGGSVSEQPFTEYLNQVSDNDAHTLQDAAIELLSLTALLEECKGNGGDEQWRGDWYPITLIRDSYFERYAQELAEEMGAIKHDLGWPYDYIDWERAAAALQMDYTSVEFDGDTYWVR